jgi:hypothetical protein
MHPIELHSLILQHIRIKTISGENRTKYNIIWEEMFVIYVDNVKCVFTLTPNICKDMMVIKKQDENIFIRKWGFALWLWDSMKPHAWYIW